MLFRRQTKQAAIHWCARKGFLCVPPPPPPPGLGEWATEFDRGFHDMDDSPAFGAPVVTAPTATATFASTTAAAAATAASDDDDGEEEADFNPFGVNEYAEDINTHLRRTELRYRPRANFMSAQTDVKPKMRAILVDWLIEVAGEFGLTTQTLHLAVLYLDRFLAGCVIDRRRLQLVGVTCMMLACKYEEVTIPKVAQFINITDNSYTIEQVCTVLALLGLFYVAKQSVVFFCCFSQLLLMEHMVLSILQFNMASVTPIDFAHRYLRAADASDQGEKLFHVCHWC
jgi:hypothetical protein